MGFRTGSYARIWSSEPGPGNFQKVRLSISKKSRDTGEYIDEFSGFVAFVGTAKDAAAKLHDGDRIRLGDVDVTRKWDKERQKEYINFTVFSFEMADNSNLSRPAQGSPSEPEATEGAADELPF